MAARTTRQPSAAGPDQSRTPTTRPLPGGAKSEKKVGPNEIDIAKQYLAGIIQAFCADANAMSSTMNVNVYFDVVMCVLAQALTAPLGVTHPGSRSPS